MFGRIFRKTLRDERGSFSVEAILMFPLLVWALMAMYVFFEGLREANINLKASYTLADLLSREEGLITEDYLTNTRTVYAWLSRATNPVAVRVTVVSYDEASDSHELKWSRGRGKPDLVQEDIATVVSPHVPIMADQSSTIVVETWTTYDPVMNIGLSETDIYNIVVTAPRFADQLRLEGVGDGTGTTHDDGNDATGTL